MDESAEEAERRAGRTNMLVMATLYSATGSAAVKIRNLSSSGALVEGGVIPPPKARISLCRGSLKISGEVVWRNCGRAGLRFESQATVADWLPKGLRSSMQQRVDEVVQQAKTASIGPPINAEPTPANVSAIELAYARKMIEALADALADDPDVVSRHGSKLQALDMAVQLFAKLERDI